MNIFKVLFGKKESVDSSTPVHPAENYIARAVSMANASESVSELTMLARDYSGYVRQAAVSRCAILAKPELLQVIVDRLNDWVPAVRHTARSAMMTVIPFIPPLKLLDMLPAVQHLHAAGRADHTQWIELFEQNLIRLIDAQDILAAARGSNIKVARASFHILKKYCLLEPATLLRLILDAGNDIVLASEAVQLVGQLPREAQRIQYLLAYKSHFGSVRTFALRVLLTTEDATNLELAKSALLDLQSSVRDVAAAFMRSTEFDLRQFYRNVLDQHARLPVKTMQVALTSLASLHNVEDIVLLKTYLSHPRPSVRKATLTAWLKLSAGDKDEIAIAALADDAAVVRKFALQVVRKHGAFIPFSFVRLRLDEIGDLALLLSFSQSRVWDGLECIAQSAMHNCSDIERRRLLTAALRDWIARAGHRYEAVSVAQRGFLTSPAVIQIFRELLGKEQGLMKRLELELLH